MDTWLRLDNPAWLVAFFVVMWVAMLALLNLMSGWWSLLREHRAEEPAQGRRFLFVSGQIGRGVLAVNYGKILVVTPGPRGFRLAVTVPFGLLSPPLFLPWDAVESLEWMQGGLKGRQVRVQLRGQWPRITIRGPAAQALHEQHAAWQAAGGAVSGGRTAVTWPYS